MSNAPLTTVLPCCQYCGSTNMEIPVLISSVDGSVRSIDSGYAYCLDCDDNDGQEGTNLDSCDYKTAEIKSVAIVDPLVNLYAL